MKKKTLLELSTYEKLEEKKFSPPVDDPNVGNNLVRKNYHVEYQKPQALARPWIFPEDSEVDSDDSDATVEMLWESRTWTRQGTFYYTHAKKDGKH
jgi:hypothetical protein